MVGSVSASDRPQYGQILSRYLGIFHMHHIFLPAELLTDDPDTIFIISSDFMHFGDRFGYTYYDPAHGPVHASIAAVDRLGMDAIETLKSDQFDLYLKEYRNTICGRNPISILLHTIEALGSSHFKMKFVHYAQSSACESMQDSSVSYAAGLLETRLG
jgi:MEMO1 family protein